MPIFTIHTLTFEENLSSIVHKNQYQPYHKNHTRQTNATLSKQAHISNYKRRLHTLLIHASMNLSTYI
ncbi:hypothetical protein EYC84_009119 [Monilinia fructicola]|uniref:Uncharacterized protein n=1 Tax=Monilinia fructicola TaxID=38448 RepID=A0A5M9JBE6_MONFR|nr:hypothetical protein EYC84_009119 [Monilinia fructicola]